MNTERSGGVFLLQEMKPKRLLGSLISITSETGPGWIHGSFFNEPESISFTSVGDKTELVLSQPVALSLIGILPVLVATNAHLRNRNVRWTCEVLNPGRIAVNHRLEMEKRCLVASWVPDPESIISEVVGNQIEWRIHEDLAMELFFSLVAQLAQTAAGNEARLQTS
jgi:hypothetical protein